MVCSDKGHFVQFAEKLTEVLPEHLRRRLTMTKQIVIFLYNFDCSSYKYGSKMSIYHRTKL